MDIFRRCITLVLVLFSVVTGGCSLITSGEKTIDAEQTVLIEAESFDALGGWVVDQQSIDLIGSSYILAHGMGIPVADASTTITFPSPGKYYVWVRTRDWVAPWDAPGAPGKFELLIDGEAVPAVFGTEGAQWHWQSGGAVDIVNEKAKITLRDLTGFEGRCDAIVFTKDSSFTVPNDKTKLCAFRKKMLNITQAPNEAKQYDLVVIGGGMSGACAAVSAARLGLDVALIQNRPVLGGNNSSEVRVLLNGEVNLPPYPALGDLVRELDCGYWANGGPAKEYRDGRKLRVVDAEENLDLFLNTHAYKVEMDGDKITAVIAKDIRTNHQMRFKGKLFADCTGDGTIGFLAGADYRIGRESRQQTGELLAPLEADKMVMGMTVQWYSSMMEEPSSFPDCPWAVQLDRKTYQPGPVGGWNWEAGLNRDQINEVEYVRDYNFRVIYGNWAYLKNHSREKAQYANRKLDWVGYIGGKRESRRLLGDLVLRQQDIQEQMIYTDAFVVSTWTIDLHFPDPDNTKHFPGNEFRTIAKQTQKQPYPIPYRCFYSRNVPNLFMAGRNISTTHVAMGTTRVMRTCGMMGEVVGMAASLCRKHDALPRQIYTEYLDELKGLATKGVGKIKRKEIMTVPPEWIDEAGENLAMKAKVNVSSCLDEEKYSPAFINDGKILMRQEESRWTSEPEMPQWVEFSWDTPQRINAVRCVSGKFLRISSSPQKMIAEFVFQYHDGTDWKDIPELRVSRNRRFDWSERFKEVYTDKIRLFVTDSSKEPVRLLEVEFYHLEKEPTVNPDSKSIQISSDYEAGNIIVEKVEDDIVYLRQDLRDTEGWWFYWNFQAKTAMPGTVTFQFTDKNPIGVLGPAVSTDQGTTWSWLGAESVTDSSFKYTFKEAEQDVRFSFCIPYYVRYQYQKQPNPYIETTELCKSGKGRPVPLWRFGRLDGECAYRVFFTVRHHACETMGNYVLDGIIEEILSDSETGKWFREHVECAAVPFVDFDGVVEGDQGKNRKPHDHNRDYAGQSIYRTVAAIREFVPQWSQGKLVATFDLHCPWIRGAHEEVIYIVGSSNPEIWKQQCIFSEILQDIQQGTLEYRASDNLPFGEGWNTAGNYGSGKNCSGWMAQQEGVVLATGIETPYARANGQTVTAETAREFGHDLARAICRYLKKFKK